MTTKKIINSLWFDDKAEQAAHFYTSIFSGSRVGDLVTAADEGFEIHGRPPGSTMLVEFELWSEPFIAINGGPMFKFNPSMSYYVVCETMEETNRVWESLLQGGSVMMPLQKYDWSERYGWLRDRYGLSWQISYGKVSDVGQRITPSFLFTGDQFGRAQQAIEFWTSIFSNSSVTGLLKGTLEDGREYVVHAQFVLKGQMFMIMESAAKEHHFKFNEAVSLIVRCNTQQQIDYYWESLKADGGRESQCGWLKDKFGISWQVDSSDLASMLKDSDDEKRRRVTKAFLKMKKFNLDELRAAFDGTEGRRH